MLFCLLLLDCACVLVFGIVICVWLCVVGFCLVCLLCYCVLLWFVYVVCLLTLIVCLLVCLCLYLVCFVVGCVFLCAGVCFVFVGGDVV